MRLYANSKMTFQSTAGIKAIKMTASSAAYADNTQDGTVTDPASTLAYTANSTDATWTFDSAQTGLIQWNRGTKGRGDVTKITITVVDND